MGFKSPEFAADEAADEFARQNDVETGPRDVGDLESLLARINALSRGVDDDADATIQVDEIPPEHEPQHAKPSLAERRFLECDIANSEWRPAEPKSLEEGGLSEGQVEQLAVKIIYATGDVAGHTIADQMGLPFRLVEPVLQAMKAAQLVGFRGSAPLNDFVYTLTDLGRDRARRLAEQCSYFGQAPVTLQAYCASIQRQSLANTLATMSDLRRAFSDLLMNERVLRRLGSAVNSQRGLFLFGEPGNGKTSIAERVTSAFGDSIWIPRVIGVDGEMMRIFDPAIHDESPVAAPRLPSRPMAIDRRWVRIRRPTVVVGGELTMEALEVQPSSGTNVSEAPLQVKSNCGTLVIDDFGRQRMATDELLNRWIVPLEKRYDFLRMVNGKKIQVPFDQLVIFSTNLEPRDLVDEAFLRRIPYKIEIGDPSEEEFRKLFEIMAAQLGVKFDIAALDYLVEKHYRDAGRPFRCCQPRDLLQQLVNDARFLGGSPEMTRELMDYAVESYFTIM